MKNNVVPLPTYDSEEWGLFRDNLESLRRDFVGRKIDARERATQLLDKYKAQANICAGQARLFAQDAVIELVELLEEFKHSNLVNKGQTGPASIKPQQAGAIVELHKSKFLNDNHVKAAKWIRQIVEAVTSPMTAKCSSTGIGGGNYESITEKMAWYHHHCLRPWGEEMKALKINPNIVLSVCVDGVSVKRVAIAHNIGHNRAKNILRAGLSLYLKVGLQAPKYVEENA